MIEFSDAIRASGLEPPLSIEPGAVIRFPGIGKGAKNKAAWCRLFDDCIGGVFGDYSSGLYEVWQSRRTETYTPDQRAEFMRQVEASRKEHAQDRAREAVAAAQKAKAIIGSAKQEQHAYLDAHNMRERVGLVYYPDEKTNLLCIPMRVGNAIVGCQLIDRDGNKRFLKGQKTVGAEYVLGSRGIDVWVEGFCTGAAVQTALQGMKIHAKVHVTFSAGNLKKMARCGVIIADHDKSKAGELAAAETGLPFYLPENEGDDFCDEWQRIGTFQAGMKLRQWLQKENTALRA